MSGDPNLGQEMGLSAAMAAAVMVTHLIGLMSMLKLVRWAIDHLRTPWIALDRFAIPLLMIASLFLLHALEIWEYALVYRLIAIPTLEEALFVSTAAYSTAAMDYFQHHPAWRLVAAHESLAGMILIGWSTAFLFATLHRILTTEENHPLPEGAIAPEPAEEEG